jgi:hypothetical protein
MLFNRLFIGALILMAIIGMWLSITGHKKIYYYNAYAPGYDEYFILKSYQPLPLDTVTHFDGNAVSTKDKTGYTAKILSIY